VTFTLYLAFFGKRALLADPIGIMAIMNEMMSEWTNVEKNVRMFTLEGLMLWNRLLWLGVALLTLGFIYLRFRFEHRTTTDLLSRITRRFTAKAPTLDTAPARITIAVPQVRQSFGSATHLRQTLAIARSSFWVIAKSLPGLFLLIGFPMFLLLVVTMESQFWSVPLLPRTGYLLSKFMTAPLTQAADFRVMIPLLIVYFAGELVWRERDARLSENVDATPTPEWVSFVGKFLGLSAVLAAYMVSLTAVGMITQLMRGYYDDAGQLTACRASMCPRNRWRRNAGQ
jgi:ABC-2 type transport system permease protein